MAHHSDLTIGQLVRQYRKDRGLSQDQLAEGICSRQTISLLENGLHFPSVNFMKKIAEKLSVPLHEIMIDEGVELKSKTQLDIIEVYLETAEYGHAIELIEELAQREDLLEYQRRQLVIHHAECLIRTSKADQAIFILNELKQELEMHRDSDDYFMALLYDKLGTAEYFVSNIAYAHAHYTRAYQLSLRFPELDVNAAKIAFNLGMTCRQLNHQSDAIQYLSIAENFFKSVSDPKRLAQTLFELGITFRFNKDYERAEQYLQESLLLYKSQNLLHVARLVRESYAYTVLSLKQPQLAIHELLECAAEFEREQDPANLAYTLARTSKLLIGQGQAKEASAYLQKALGIFSDEEAAKQFKFVTVYQIYAEYLYEIKEYEHCVHYSFMASELFDKMGYIRDAAESIHPAIGAYRKLGLLEKALEASAREIDLLRRSHDQ